MRLLCASIHRSGGIPLTRISSRLDHCCVVGAVVGGEARPIIHSFIHASARASAECFQINLWSVSHVGESTRDSWGFDHGGRPMDNDVSLSRYAVDQHRPLVLKSQPVKGHRLP